MASAYGKKHFIFNSTQQQLLLCPATQQGLKHWVQAAQAANADDIWRDLRSGSAADLEEVLGKAFAAGFGSSLEESTLQHYVSLPVAYWQPQHARKAAVRSHMLLNCTVQAFGWSQCVCHGSCTHWLLGAGHSPRRLPLPADARCCCPTSVL